MMMAEGQTSESGPCDSVGDGGQALQVQGKVNKAATTPKKIAQAACEICRRKRTKCVREQGQTECAACRMGGFECIYSGIDKRKESIKNLRARLANLEDLFARLRGAGIQETQNLLEDIRQGNAMTALDTMGAATGTASTPSIKAFKTEGDHDQVHIHSEGGTHLRRPPYSSTLSDWNSAARRAEATTSMDIASDGEAGRSPTDRRDDSLDGGDSISSSEFVDGLVLQRHRRGEDIVAASDAGPGYRSHDSRSGELLDRLIVADNGKIRAVSSLSLLDLDLNQDLPGSTTLKLRGGSLLSRQNLTSPLVHEAQRSVSVQQAGTRQYAQQPLQSSSDTYFAPLQNYGHPQIVVPTGVTEEMIDNLLTTYFLWDLPEHPIISRPAFLEHMATGGPYYSSLLLNAILAWASTLSARTDTFRIYNDPHSSGDHFAQLAEHMLAQQIDAVAPEGDIPISTIQASALLTLRQFAAGQNLKAWLHIGTCARLALDAGLHLDATPLDGKAAISKGDLYVRSRTFWGIWFLEQEFSMWYGRTGPLRDVVVTCPKPGDFDTPWRWAEDFDWWKSLQLGQIIASSGPIPTSNSAFILWPFACGIADIFASSRRLIYYRVANRYIYSKTADGAAILENVMRTTRQFMSTIPQAFPTTDSTAVPSFKPLPLLLYVHMMAHCHIIIMNKPFLNSSSSSPVTALSSAGTDAADVREDTPLHRCIGSALAILALAQRWKESWDGGLRTAGNGPVHMLLTAGTIFLRETTFGIHAAEEGSTDYHSGGISAERLAQESERRQTARQRLVDELLPLLAEIAHYRKGPQRIYELLQAALKQRDGLVQEHLSKQLSQAESLMYLLPVQENSFYAATSYPSIYNQSGNPSANATEPVAQRSASNEPLQVSTETSQGMNVMPIGDPLHYLSKSSVQLPISSQEQMRSGSESQIRQQSTD